MGIYNCHSHFNDFGNLSDVATCVFSGDEGSCTPFTSGISCKGIKMLLSILQRKSFVTFDLNGHSKPFRGHRWTHSVSTTVVFKVGSWLLWWSPDLFRGVVQCCWLPFWLKDFFKKISGGEKDHKSGGRGERASKMVAPSPANLSSPLWSWISPLVMDLYSLSMIMDLSFMTIEKREQLKLLHQAWPVSSLWSWGRERAEQVQEVGVGKGDWLEQSSLLLFWLLPALWRFRRTSQLLFCLSGSLGDQPGLPQRSSRDSQTVRGRAVAPPLAFPLPEEPIQEPPGQIFQIGGAIRGSGVCFVCLSECACGGWCMLCMWQCTGWMVCMWRGENSWGEWWVLCDGLHFQPHFPRSMSYWIQWDLRLSRHGGM